MPRFAANLSMMYTEHAFLDRFAAAAADGFAEALFFASEVQDEQSFVTFHSVVLSILQFFSGPVN